MCTSDSDVNISLQEFLQIPPILQQLQVGYFKFFNENNITMTYSAGVELGPIGG